MWQRNHDQAGRFEAAAVIARKIADTDRRVRGDD
jgi:hypothetical protein